MVRVFSIYQFDGQSIYRIPGDIRSASLIDPNHLALAKSDHVIEIVSLQNGQFDQHNPDRFGNDSVSDENNIQTKYAFPTVDEVVEMVYCKIGKGFFCFFIFNCIKIYFVCILCKNSFSLRISRKIVQKLHFRFQNLKKKKTEF